MQAYNPFGAPAPVSEAKGGGIYTEDPASVENIVWQTRPAALTAEEEALADALMAIFGDGIWDIEGCVAALNNRGIPGAEGDWTPASFEARLRSLSEVTDFARGAVSC